MNEASPRPNRRQRQATQTREEILQAARTLFAAKGYHGTTIKDVAQAAGVSVQTVYDSVGSKAALVLGLNDLIDAEAGVGPLAGATMVAGEPAALRSLAARITRAILESSGDIVRIAMSAASDEPELQRLAEEGQRRHAAGVQAMLGRLASVRALPAGVDPAEAAETVIVLTDLRLGLLLRDNYGWGTDRIERWMTEMVDRALTPRG